MSSSVSVIRHGGIVEEHVDPVVSGLERTVTGFASLQFFALIYLQKFALFAPAFSLSVPMLIMFASIGWMVMYRKLTIVASRMTVFLIFFGFCLFSESLNQGSATSFMQVALLYGCMTVCAHLSVAAYGQILNRFIMLMILPAIIIIVQYTYQRYTGLSDPINLELLFPKSVLMPGFFYNAHYPWNSTFSRPNGFFFLEPSFASAFTASAAILEIAYFRRPWRVVLMVVATALSMGATGISMLVIAAPVLLSRTRLRVAVVATIVVIIALMTAYLLDVPLPLISRAGEFADPKSSAYDRMLNPATEFVASLTDPSSGWVGSGAGSSPPGQVWPLLKLLREYGPLAAMSFLALYVTGVVKHCNLALMVALSAVYHFTGGYLLSPAMVELVVMFCFILAPNNELNAPDVVATDPRRRSARA